MNRAMFTAGRRTPFGRAFKGAYRDVRADDLLVELLRAQAAEHPGIHARTVSMTSSSAVPIRRENRDTTSLGWQRWGSVGQRPG